MKKEENFWDDETRYGHTHASSEQTTNNKRCLLIFVHGIFGHSQKTWGNMPEWVIKHDNLDIDVASFSYPTGIFHRCSIPQAADDLITWLETEFQEYHHLIFVTHSTGGLVVKRALTVSFNNLKKDKTGEIIPYTLSKHLFLRTRRVINIAVPHEGGSAFATIFGNLIYGLIYLFSAPFLKIIRFLSQGQKDLGKNRIIPALRRKNKWLKKLDQNFNIALDQALSANLPVPGIYDICAKADLSVPFSSDPEGRKLYVRGTHGSIKIPNRVNSPIVSIVADRIEQFGLDMATNIAAYMLVRIAEVNQATGISGLISSKTAQTSGEEDTQVHSFSVHSAGSQAEVVELLIQAIHSKTEQPKQLVITGAAGVGKSIATRMLAWKLGLNFLTAPESGAAFPLFIPLQQVNVSNLSESEYSWEMLWSWWLNWGKSIFKESHCDLQWLEEQFNNRPIAIILDGLDDFMHNHPSIGFSNMIAILNDVLSRYSSNRNFTLIIGIRSSIHGLERLVKDKRDIYEVLRLSKSQAKEIYPNCIHWIDSIQDASLMDFILTPLILANYEPEPNFNQKKQQPLTQFTLMNQSIGTIMGRSNIVGKRLTANQTIENVYLKNALSFIAWLFHYKSRGEINIETLQKEAQEQKEKWQTFFEHEKINDEDFFYAELVDEMDEILAGFDLLIQTDLCNGIFQRTVFVPTGRGRVRFAHRLWQEFLLSQYLALCIKSQHFAELGMTAFHSRIYKMSGDVFGKQIITEQSIRKLLETWQTYNKNTYITGNLIAFLSWTPTAIEPKAIQRLLKEILNVGQLSRIVLMGGLASRILANHPDDVSLSDLRRALLPQMKTFACDQSAEDPVVSSLSWCYQKAFSSQLNIEAPEQEWPILGIEDKYTLKALPVICSEKENEFVLDERSKSLQHAFIVPVFEAFNDHALLIRAVHYLYYLVVAQKHGVHSVELAQELPHLMAKDGEMEKIVLEFDVVPELAELFKNCQQIHTSY